MHVFDGGLMLMDNPAWTQGVPVVELRRGADIFSGIPDVIIFLIKSYCYNAPDSGPSRQYPNHAQVAKSVDARDLKSLGTCRAGSSPALGTI